MQRILQIQGWTRTAALALGLACLSGCGGAIGQFQDLPETTGGEGKAWPRLVDVPEAPEGGISPAAAQQRIAALGDAADEARRTAPRAEAGLSPELFARAAAPKPDPESLRVDIDEEQLLERAVRAEQTAAGADIDVARLEARRVAANPEAGVDTARLDARRVGASAEAGFDSLALEARAQNARSRASDAAAAPVRIAQSPSPAARGIDPAQLEKLEKPVLSGSFEEKARKALKRAGRR